MTFFDLGFLKYFVIFQMMEGVVPYTPLILLCGENQVASLCWSIVLSVVLATTPRSLRFECVGAIAHAGYGAYQRTRARLP